MKPFTCSCGTRTTAPFHINGRYMCTLCAEEFFPGIVSSRARKDWGDFIATKPKFRRRTDLDRYFNDNG